MTEGEGGIEYPMRSRFEQVYDHLLPASGTDEWQEHRSHAGPGAGSASADRFLRLINC